MKLRSSWLKSSCDGVGILIQGWPLRLRLKLQRVGLWLGGGGGGGGLATQCRCGFSRARARGARFKQEVFVEKQA